MILFVPCTTAEGAVKHRCGTSRSNKSTAQGGLTNTNLISHWHTISAHLYFLCTFGPAADIAVRHRDGVWKAVTAGLIHQIPGKDGGVLLVQPVVDAVPPVHHSVNVALEQLLDIWVCEEDVITFSACPLDVLQVQHTRCMLCCYIGRWATCVVDEEWCARQKCTSMFMHRGEDAQACVSTGDLVIGNRTASFR